MGVKGCWTCRERKIRCDSHRPRCENCTKARRVCQGYGIQLSWPKGNDRRRAIISGNKRSTVNSAQSNYKMFLNASSWDVSLSEELENGILPIKARYLRTMKVPRPVYLSPTRLNREESHLLGFFNESRSLILGPTDEDILAHFILRVAFSGMSDASNPVLQGVLALASQQLHGSLESSRYKHHAISSVKGSLNWLDERMLLQNLMATMLLYHFELSLESNSKGNWVVYICAVKKIINTSPTVHKLIRQEFSVFLDWIYYHEALAEFTVRHWTVPYEGCGYAPIARSPRVIAVRDTTALSNIKPLEENIGCPIDVLQLIVHTCRRAIVSSEDGHTDTETERIEKLERSVSSATGDCGPVHIQTLTPLDRNAMVADLHRIACLIYVNRAVYCVSGTEFRHRRLVREGILLLTKMVTCQYAWPLFIIACEAIEDEQRLAILDVFEQSRRDPRRRSSHIHFIQHMVEAVWSQHDLNEKQLDFLTIIDAVVGRTPFMPPFV